MPGEWRHMRSTCSKVGLLPLWHGLATSEEKQEVVTQLKKARRSSRCGPCFHLLHQQVYLLGLDPTAAAAPQTKVATTKVQAESRRAAAAQSGVPSSKPPGRKGIQLAQMAATKHASIFYFTSSRRVHISCLTQTSWLDIIQ